MRYILTILVAFLTSGIACAQETPQAVQNDIASIIKAEEAMEATRHLAHPNEKAAITADEQVEEIWDEIAKSANELDGNPVDESMTAWGKWESETPQPLGKDGTYSVFDKAAAPYALPEGEDMKIPDEEKK